MAKELNIRKELQKRKFKITNRPYYWFYKTVMDVVARKYNAHFEVIDDINKEEGPCFLVFNHLSRIDHYYVMKAIYPRRMNMLAGNNEFYRSHLQFAFRLNNILPKKQYCSNDLTGTKAMLEIIKQGGVVALAPEGLASNDGMNKPVVPKTGSMFKKFGIPVYFCELRGEYLQNTKVCLDIRHGATYATVKRLFSKEDLQNKSVEELDDALNLAFKHDEYAWQKEKHIKWETYGRICYRLNDLLWECPKCHSMMKMEAGNDYIKCTECGNGATMDDYYDFHPFDDSCVIPETVSRWADMERMSIIREIRKNPEFYFEDECELGLLPNDHYVKDKKYSEKVADGILRIDHNGLTFKGKDDSTHDISLDYKSLYTTITEGDSTAFQIYVNGEFTEFTPKHNVVIYCTYLIEEMHRLHVNTYKNFSWKNYMYEGLDEEKSE